MHKNIVVDIYLYTVFSEPLKNALKVANIFLGDEHEKSFNHMRLLRVWV